jgi:SAM-dependent methyltransferase
VCGAPLRRTHGRLTCGQGHSFPVDEFGVPSLIVEGNTAEHSISEDDAAAHAAMHAFAAQTLGRGEAEGLYRTVSDLLLRGSTANGAHWILDAGCGPGRTLVDAATAFPKATVVGVDRSPGALVLALAITRLTGQSVMVDLRRWGFGQRALRGYGLRNTVLARAAVEQLPFASSTRWSGFDAITCVNLLDRTADPVRALGELARVAKPGARLVLTTPLNWRGRSGQPWDALGTLSLLTAAVERVGFEVDLAFDGLVYRELLDVRGSVTDWDVAVVSARRRPE